MKFGQQKTSAFVIPLTWLGLLGFDRDAAGMDRDVAGMSPKCKRTWCDVVPCWTSCYVQGFTIFFSLIVTQILSLTGSSRSCSPSPVAMPGKRFMWDCGLNECECNKMLKTW